MSSISTEQPTDMISWADFQAAITRAVDNRRRIYNNTFALTIRWEQDNTNASTDTENFQAILSTLNLDQAEVMILAEQDRTPGWTVSDKMRSIFRLAANAPGKSIFLVHYAGHGDVRGEELFAVEGRSRRSINFQHFIERAVANEYDFGVENTDTVFILDCCYSHVATRALNPSTRTVEILSASDAQTPEALAPPRNTLTGKLRGEIARRRRAGHHSVTLSDVMATIRINSSVVKPTHQVRLGVSVCFPFAGVTRIDPNTIAPELRAVFSVYIVEHMSQEQAQRFLAWIENLPPAFALELDGIYPTSSTLLIFQGAYALFTNLAQYPGVTLLSEATRSNRRKLLGQVQRKEASSSTLKENVPFSRRPKR